MLKKMYVGNLPYDTTEQQVRSLFEEFGEVESLAMIMDRDTGRFRGFCFVEMQAAAADAAIEALDGKDYNGRDLRVNEARPRDDQGGGGRRGGGGSRGGGQYGGGGQRGGGRQQRGSKDRRERSYGDDDRW